MAKQSAGVLVYRRRGKDIEVLLVHPGGPFWAKKDNGAWSVPKGEYTDEEETLGAAKREFQEELGQPAPAGNYYELGQTKLASGKIITAWAVQHDLGAVSPTSNTFSLEWPPRSGQQQEFPEVDRAEWFSLPKAAKKIHPGQSDFLSRLADHLQIPITEAIKPDQKLDDHQMSLL